MHSQLALAKMRGSLQAPNSPVQDRGLEYLHMVEFVEQARQRSLDEMDRIRAMVLDHGADVVSKTGWYADRFEPEAASEEAIDSPDIEWSTPQSEAEADELSDWISQHMQGALTGGSSEFEWQ